MSETVLCEGAVSRGYETNTPRFSSIDDDGQVVNEGEHLARYQARQESAPCQFQRSGVGVRAGPTPRWSIFMLEAASSELGIRGTARLPDPAAISS
jgi:hypothetical protein